IDSLSLDMNQNVPNNDDCLNTAGIEPVNFAFLTKNGQAATSADPLNNDRFNPSSADFLMGGGDRLQVHMYDSAEGFTVLVRDLTTGTSGKMVASVDNGFASVNFNPAAANCSL